MKKPFQTRLLASSLLGLSLFGVVPAVSAAPEPNPVTTAWEFTFENGPLRLAWVDTGNGPHPYFYLTYRITNYSGKDLKFIPDVTLVTSESHVLKAGRDVSGAVTEEIMKRLDNPLLESQYDIVSDVLEGPENARDGVVIWPADDLDVDELTVFFAGLSGEYESYVVGRNTTDPRRYSLRKTLMLRYATPGDISRQGSTPFELAEKRWVMR